MTYVDGFVIPIKKSKVDAYRKMSQKAGKIWMKYGALQYKECVLDDAKPNTGGGMTTLSFRKLANAKPSDTVFFSFITYKSKAQRDKINAQVMKDPGMSSEAWEGVPMPFDPRHMAFGGFKAIVDM